MYPKLPELRRRQERIHLTFALYDLDGDGMLSLADAISLSREDRPGRSRFCHYGLG